MSRLFFDSTAKGRILKTVSAEIKYNGGFA
jgi:hypothetical protein